LRKSHQDLRAVASKLSKNFSAVLPPPVFQRECKGTTFFISTKNFSAFFVALTTFFQKRFQLKINNLRTVSLP
jgi:hypothetical protein